MSNDLEWLLLRKNNSFIVDRTVGGPLFSKEPGNLNNIHSHKFSGLANSKFIGVTTTPSGIVITSRKSNAPIRSVAKANTTTHIRARSGGRRALGIAASFAKRGYRPDLRHATLARVSALVAAQAEPKPAPAKKLRGRRAREAKNNA